MITPEQLPALYKELFIEGNWSKEYIEKLILVPSEPEDYPNALIDIGNCIDVLKWQNKWNLYLNCKELLVVGSISPWIECFLISKGALKVFVTDVNKIQIQDDRIIFLSAEELNTKKFDMIVSYSSVEHIGLGRYGDKIDLKGDIKFMDSIYDQLNDNGNFILGIPVAPEYEVAGIWHRVYDKMHLHQLVSKYKIVMSSKNKKVSIGDDIDYSIDTNYPYAWQNQPCILLRK